MVAKARQEIRRRKRFAIEFHVEDFERRTVAAGGEARIITDIKLRLR
jgi:hypothetical protein